MAQIVRDCQCDTTQNIAQAMFKETEIILVQEFIYTDFDWRVGILAGEPLFVARYIMTRDHWQILKHRADGKHEEWRTEAVAIKDIATETVSEITTAQEASDDQQDQGLGEGLVHCRMVLSKCLRFLYAASVLFIPVFTSTFLSLSHREII